MRASLFLLALTTSVSAVGAPSTTPPEIVALPEFRVFADRPLPEREKWNYFSDGNFEVLANTSARTTKRFIKDLREFQIVMSVVSPMAKIHAELPLMVVLCGKGNEFEKFAVKPTIHSTRGFATALLRDSEIASIVVDYQKQSVLDSSYLFSFLGESEREVHTSTEFFREYIHLALSQLTPRPPAWLAEGLANIYGNIDYTDKWIEVGLPKSFLNELSFQPSPGFYSSSRRFGGSDHFGQMTGMDGFDNYQWFHTSGIDSNNWGPGMSYRAPVAFQPLAKLFAVGYDSPLVTGGGKNRDYTQLGWRQQTTAFVHMCLYGEQGKYREPFLKFVARATREPATEAMFKECFGVSFKEMGTRLRGYTTYTPYTSKIYTATKGRFLSPAEAIVVRPATDAEIGRIKGETFRLAGQDAAARQEFVVAYLRGERDPQLLASLGLMARQRNDDPRAKTYLETVAVASSIVPRPRAYLELARLRYAESQTKTGAPLNADQAARVLTPLFATQNLQPQLAAVYLEIANVWEHSAVPPTRSNLAALEYGIRIFPQNGELLYRTAALLIKHGYKVDAAPLIRRALDSTRDSELRAKFETLQRQVDATPVDRTGGHARLAPESLPTPGFL